MNSTIKKLYQIQKNVVKMLIARGYLCHSSLLNQTIEEFQQKFES